MALTPQINIPGWQQLPQALPKVQSSVWPSLIIMLLISAWATLPAMAAEAEDNNAKGINIVLLMDSSGSMKLTDPDKLRKPAAKLLISLLGENDRASIVSFSDQGYPVTYLLNTADAGSQTQLFAAIEKISSRGIHTNLYSAIATAQNILAQEKDPQRRKLIVLMSDGKMDIGDEAKSRQQTEKLLSELLPQIKADNIELHAIAFTNQSDQALLANIAQETDGNFYIAASDTELHNTFSKVFEQTTQPSMLPMEGGHFQIDEAISDITIIGSKNDAEVALSLTSPDGTTYFPHNKPDNYRWLITPLFDMITINNPQSGAWELMASSNRNKAYIITDLELALSVRPNEPRVNERMQIQAWLEKDGEVVINDAILANLQLTGQVAFPDGRHAELPVGVAQASLDNGDNSGIFTYSLTPPTAGSYELSMTANSGTFQRSRNTLFNVITAPAETMTQEPPLETIVKPASEPTVEPTMEEVSADKEPGSSDDVLMLVIYAFIGTNIVLALVIGAAILWRKKRNHN